MALYGAENQRELRRLGFVGRGRSWRRRHDFWCE